MLSSAHIVVLALWYPAWKPREENCAGILDMGLCSGRPDCFPHWDGYMLTCRVAEAVNCSMNPTRDKHKLLLFASLGLVNNALKRGFRELVLQLPDVSWSVADPELGAAIKGASLNMDDCKADVSKAELAWRGMYEPDLYKDLTAVVLWDACFLKESFWNAAHPDFGRYSNYVTMSESIAGWHRQTLPRTSPKLARGDGTAAPTWTGLEDGYCEDFTPWLTEELGFAPDRVHRISLFDRLSSPNLTQMVFEIQKSGEEAPDEERLAMVQQEIVRVRAEIDAQLERKQTEATRLLALLEQADVIALNGGNPDFLKFVLMELTRRLTATWKRRVEEGRTIFLGRSAGSMVGGRDISLTSEPNPLLLEYLLPDTGAVHRGLELAGDCTIRPHYASSAWDVVVALSMQMADRRGYASVNVVRVPNEEALQCIGAQCKMIGATSRQAMSPLSRKQLRRLMRGFEDQQQQDVSSQETGAMCGTVSATALGPCSTGVAQAMAQAGQESAQGQCEGGFSDFDK